MITYVLFLLGLALLLAGGEVLVRGAVGLAIRIKVSQLVIGATIVSLGTSAPELLVSVKAVLAGHPAISVGNVVGSNIANLGLVMGLVALIFPLTTDRGAATLDWPVMMAASLLFFLMAFDGVISRLEASFLLLLFVLYVVYSILKSRKNMRVEEGDSDFTPLREPLSTPLWKLLLMITLGSAGLFFGARWFLQGAVEMAEIFGVSQHVISVTLIAFGTSVPELATSAIAAFRKQADISVGNLLGSNSFNILAIMGITAAIKDVPVSSVVVNSDLLWMLGIAALVLPFLVIGKKIYRWQGAILFALYIAYIYLVISKGV